MSVLLETSLGDIVIDLLWEKAPFACKNFIKLCKVKYYNGALFYDVQKDYLTRIMHEKKEPTSLNHMLYGEQAKYFEDQIDPEAKHNRIGTVSTANVGPNMNNSNFFMTLSDDNIQSLNGKHTIFGIIAEGADILRKINEVYVDERNRPYQNIRILHTPVLDDPFDDPPELEIPENSPEINYEETDRLDINDKIDTIEGHGRTEDEIIEETKRHEAKTKAIVLEMLNDLPDAEIKPPDNVLFVCKLNPVTQEDDLETIFSQFGPIKSCEVIRDWKTGASLQYCFIEFETQAACEEAYFKMENALIDERRIHVDFSQSVAKYWYKYKSGQPIAFNGKGGKGGDKEGGGGHRGPRLELKRQHREDRGSYGIVIDEDEAHRERRHQKNRENRNERENKPREENRPPREDHKGGRDNRPREENRGERDRPREDNRRRDDHREREKERERRKSRSRSGERRRERKREEETKGRRDDRRSRSRSQRREKRDSGRDKEREKERERERARDRTRDDREKRHSEKDRRRDDHRSSRKEEKKRKQSSSSSRSSSSSSSSSGSRSSS